jgi:hypothetical protein
MDDGLITLGEPIVKKQQNRLFSKENPNTSKKDAKSVYN